ncbi:MAG: hypothetical protein ACM3PZ_00015 [Bacillota bacterium]
MDLITTGTAIIVGKKLLGKTFDVVSADIANLYEKGRDKIIEKATKKISDVNDGKSSNLRVTRDVFWNGSFTDESICAEYFGGILASSRSEDGKDDNGVYYVDLIKSLSSNQLKLHYLIYHAFNKYFSSHGSEKNLNPGQESELSAKSIFLCTNELLAAIKGGDFGRDLHAIRAKGLIGDFEAKAYPLKNQETLPYLKVSPKPLGVQLYAVAYNKIDQWRDFAITDFGSFDSVISPKFCENSMEKLLEVTGIKTDEDSQNATNNDLNNITV